MKNLPPEVLSAIVAGIISTLISVVTFIVSKKQFRQKLNAEIEAVKQTQFQSVINERLNKYPLLWNIIISKGYNDIIKEAKLDKVWVKNLWSELLKCNEQIGYLFSQSLYEKFHEFMNDLVDLLNKEQITDSEIEERVLSFITGENGIPGLASLIKDDFGSYNKLAIQGDGKTWI
jgi:hypothetical protein